MADSKTPNPRRKRLLLIAAGVFLLIAVLWAIWYFIYGANKESTEDAYVHGNLVQITSQVAGTVVAIEADDTDMVKAGQPLVKLDPADAQIALMQAEAQLAQTVRQTRTLYVQNDSLTADTNVRSAEIVRAEADVARTQSDLQRRQALAKSGGVSGEELLHAQTAYKTSQSNLAQARAALAGSRAKAQTNRALTEGTTVENHPDVLRAAANLRSVWLAGSRNTLPAPVDGMVARRSAQVGQRIAPGTPLMTVVPLDQVWVEANFKEGQLRDMRVGQPVILHADLYGGDVVYHGKVAGLDAGTGSAFALLPAQNATGNWIKVVQRVPVRIALDPQELAKRPLRVGLSMSVEVDLGTTQGEPVTTTHAQTGMSTSAFDPAHGEADALIQRIVRENLAS
ncbi:MAG: HlyD family efflux transporter periplasmic adaptor subunit [Achromobacter sp.]|jgi:membrane fusion protein (multidrug efflux system)